MGTHLKPLLALVVASTTSVALMRWCSEPTAADEIAALERSVAIERAELVRERADCVADAIEAPALASVCWKYHRQQATLATERIDTMQRAIRKLRE